MTVTPLRLEADKEVSRDMTNQQNECAPSKDSDQPGHPPSLIRVFACVQRVVKDPSFLHEDSENWSDWADAQADLSLRWAHTHFVRFVMSRLKWFWLQCQYFRWHVKHCYQDSGIFTGLVESNNSWTQVEIKHKKMYLLVCVIYYLFPCYSVPKSPFVQIVSAF